MQKKYANCDDAAKSDLSGYLVLLTWTFIIETVLAYTNIVVCY